MPRYPNETVPTQMRLPAETLAHADLIARELKLLRPDGSPNRSAAVRTALERLAEKISRKKRKSG